MSAWPELDPARDAGTWTLLHLAAQMLGKLRVAHAAWVNHGWHVALQPAVNGLSMAPSRCPADASRCRSTFWSAGRVW